MVRAVPGPAPPLLALSGAPTAGTIAAARRLMLGDSRPDASRASCRCWATTTSPTRWRPRWRRSRRGGDARARRGGAPHLPRDPASGRAGARGGRRALDQRLEVHQHHLDRGRDRRARPAVRAAARRAAQGRAVYPAGRAARAAAAGRWWRTARRGRSWCGTSAAQRHRGPGRRLRRRAARRRAGWPSRATRCCCLPPAPATTCSRTTRSAASASAPPSRRCERSDGRSAIRASCAGRPGCSASSRWCCWPSASRPPTARRAW